MLKPADQRLNNNNDIVATNDRNENRNRGLFIYHFLINNFDV